MFSAKLEALEQELASVPLNPTESRQFIRDILDKFQKESNRPDPTTSHVATNDTLISKCFGADVTTVEEIVQNLSQEASNGNEWANKTLHVSHNHSF